MPVYLAHGFRWPRGGFTGVRVHAIVNNLEDMTVEYIQNQRTQSVILQNFRDLYPTLMAQLEDTRTAKTLHFLEQYDPEDESTEAAVSQSFAYVADRVITMAAGNTLNTEIEETTPPDRALHPPNPGPARGVASPHSPASNAGTSDSSLRSSPLPHHNPSALSISLEDAMSSVGAVTPQAWDALAELRDKIAEGEKIGWWIIYNGDPDRLYDEDDDSLDSDREEDAELYEEGARTPTQAEPLTNGILGQPMPTLLPPGLENLKPTSDDSHQIGTAIPLPPPPPPPPLERPPAPPGGGTATRPKSSRSAFHVPLGLRMRSSKANLKPRKDEEIPEPPKLKEISKKEGFRQKFFGRGVDKK